MRNPFSSVTRSISIYYLRGKENEDRPGKPELEINGTEETQITLYKELTKKQIIKNLLVICIGFHLLFTGYNGLSVLQSTINPNQGIGVISQAIIFASFCITSLLLPKYVIKKLGLKRTMALSMCCYPPYIAANFFFHWVTMVPSAILCGLGSSLLWNCHAAYFNEASHIYSLQTLKGKQTKRDYLKSGYGTGSEERSFPTPFKIPDKCQKSDNLDASKLDNNPNVAAQKQHYQSVSSVSALFFGLFSLSYRTSDIWSSLMSFYILRDGKVLDNVTIHDNCSCGASFCNVDSKCYEHNLAEPNQQMRTILTAASLLLAFIGTLLVFQFLDELEEERQPVKFSFSFAIATCKFVKTRDALLLFPLSLYIGLHQGFYLGDFTKSYVACAWGIYHIGLVGMCYGVTTGITATLAGFLVRYVGRISVMMFAAVVNAGMNAYFLLWHPLSQEPVKFFISAALWGVVIGIIHPQTRAYYGLIFKENAEAAFGGFYLWDSIGYCVAFLYSNYICTYLKVYILLAVSTLAFVGYLATEIKRLRVRPHEMGAEK